MKSSCAIVTVLALICALLLPSNDAAAQSCKDKCQSAHNYRLGSCEREKAMLNHCRNSFSKGASLAPCKQGLLDFNYDKCLYEARVTQKQCFRRCG
jgi:hypothetical protein